jgi:apolipoprotein N-acyltransferase
LWVTWELARARVLTGDPWLLLGYALAPYPLLIQIADLGGVYLVSFVLAFLNAALSEMVDEMSARWRARRLPSRDETRFPQTAGSPGGSHSTLGSFNVPAIVVSVASLVAFTAAYGRYRLNQPLPSEPAIPIAVVQGNNNLGSQWKAEYYGEGLDTYLRLSESAATQHPRVLIWPESALTFFLAREPQYQARIARLLRDSDSDLIVGAPHIEDGDPARPHYFNSAFYVVAGGELRQRYDKVHLMPFGEYFPLRTIEFLRRRFERVRYFTPGDDLRLLDTRLGKTAVVICFEAMFPELVRARMNAGAEVLVNLSNDAWLGNGAGPPQHAAMTIFRAVENRTWVVRATTTGVSMVIDPYGRVRAEAPRLEPAVLQASIIPLRIDTIYKRYGDTFAFACPAISAIAMFALWRNE